MRPKLKLFPHALLLSFLLTLSAGAQTGMTLSENARVSLLTIYPGNELYSTFGHSAIRIVDPAYKLDRIYNYGTFSFEEPGFYIKFCRGKLDYQLAAYSYSWAEAEYTQDQRPIIEQKLRLTPAMRQAVFQFLEWNYLPDNRRYRYDFFFDNCATRIRDVFENTLGDSLALYYNDSRQMTFRDYIDLYLVNLPFSDYGIDLGLGAKTDRLATAREALFLPDYLYEAFGGATITIGGETLPLVSATDTLLWFEGRQTPPTRDTLPWADIVLWGVLGVSAVVTLRNRSSRDSTLLNRWLDYPLFGLTGLVGWLIVFLWFFTDHTSTPNNWNILWAWPTHLFIFLAPSLLKRYPGGRIYFAVCAGVMLLTLLGWPLWPQRFNTATIPLVLALMVRSGWMAWGKRRRAKGEGRRA